MATKKISELTAVTTPTGADTFVIVQGGVTYKVTGANNASVGADIASAATTDIGAATGEYLQVTGTTTITALGTVASGTKRVVRFTGVLILTHNATSLILPTAANITTAVDDIAEFISLGSGNWICSRYARKDGLPLSGGSLVRAFQATPETVTTASWAQMSLGTESYDTDSEFASSTFTAKRAGKYIIQCAVSWATNNIGDRWAAIYVNDVLYSTASITAINARETVVSHSDSVQLAINGTIKLYAYQGSGGNLNTSTTFPTFLSISKIG